MDLKNLKLILGIFFLIMLVLSVSAIYASDNSKEVTLLDVKFNIPHDFEEDKNLSEERSKTIYFSDGSPGIITKSFANETDNINISVVYIQAEDYEIDELSPNHELKNINGKKGIYIDEPKSFYFGYLEKGNFVAIEATNEELLENAIV